MKRLRLGLLGAVAISSLAHAAAPAAENLAELRIEVDDLSASLREARDDSLARLKALRDERSDLQRQIRLARVRNDALSRIERDMASQVAHVEADVQRWSEPARAATESVRGYVRSSLPFASVERLERVDHIAAELDGPHSDAARAMELLWRFIEEEAAMTGEVTMARQALELDGETRLTDVLRVGMVLLYVRANDGRLAWAVRRDAQWQFEWLSDPLAQTIVAALFEAHEANEVFGPTDLLIPRVTDGTDGDG